jgi:IS30 family transposase
MQNIPSKRYHHLQPEERMTLASLVQQQYTAGEIAKVLKRSTSTVTREIKRNAQSTGYSSQAAQTCAVQRRIQARAPRKLHSDGVLFGVVHYFLCIRWSPEQIALTLTHTYPKGHELRVSHETIYNCIYAQPVGELKKT